MGRAVLVGGRVPGTDLYRDAEREGRYLVVDRWRSAADQRAFLEARREEYDALGRRTEALWTAERRIGAFDLD